MIEEYNIQYLNLTAQLQIIKLKLAHSDKNTKKIVDSNSGLFMFLDSLGKKLDMRYYDQMSLDDIEYDIKNFYKETLTK